LNREYLYSQNVFGNKILICNYKDALSIIIVIKLNIFIN